MPTTPAPSLRRNLVNVVCVAAGFLAVAAALLSLYFAGVIGSVADERSQAELGDSADAMRPPVVGSPAYVLAQHEGDCWTAAQNGGLPSAAIVQTTGGEAAGMTVHTTDPVLVDAAFSEVLHGLGFDEEPTTGAFRVIALCSR